MWAGSLNVQYAHLVDIFPEVLYDSYVDEKALDNASCLVIASPTKNFCQKEKNTNIANGGSLLIIEGANPNSTINQIANLFDVNIRLYPYRNIMKRINKERGINKNEGLDLNPARVEGGNVLFEYDEQMPVVCFKQKGKGLICVIGDDGLFMKKNLQFFDISQ